MGDLEREKVKEKLLVKVRQLSLIRMLHPRLRAEADLYTSFHDILLAGPLASKRPYLSMIHRKHLHDSTSWCVWWLVAKKIPRLPRFLVFTRCNLLS